MSAIDRPLRETFSPPAREDGQRKNTYSLRRWSAFEAWQEHARSVGAGEAAAPGTDGRAASGWIPSQPSA